MTYKERAADIQGMMSQGKALDAFEKYYHNDIVMVECTGQKREGKDVNREFEKGFFASIAEMHGAGVTAITSDEEAGVSMVESWMEVTYKDGNRMKMEQIARQKWQGDQIIEERFYYDTRGM